MKEVKSLQDLPAPTPQDLGFHHLKALKITIQREQEQNFVVKLKRILQCTVTDDINQKNYITFSRPFPYVNRCMHLLAANSSEF